METGIQTTRAQRRKLDRDNAKLPSKLQVIPKDKWPASAIGGGRLQVWRSRDFLVQVFMAPAPAAARLSVNRTKLEGVRWVEGITWDELQRLKAECGFGNHTAVEVYPPDRDVVNVANMRHLWVLPYSLPFAWTKS